MPFKGAKRADPPFPQHSCCPRQNALKINKCENLQLQLYPVLQIIPLPQTY